MENAYSFLWLIINIICCCQFFEGPSLYYFSTFLDFFWSIQFCQFPFGWIYYCHSSKSIGKETGKTHLCALWRLSQQKSTDKWVFNICCRLLWIKSHKCHNPIFSRYQLMFWLQQVFFYHRCFLIMKIDFFSTMMFLFI